MTEKEVWRSFDQFFAVPFTKSFLSQCYENLSVENHHQKSYENCYTFIYYLQHGKIYYKMANQSPIEIKPVLLFYGFIQLLKACILTVDPHYPESTRLLAHGVSTRKRKKQQYTFLNDEVKVQKNGLFSHFSSTMFHVKHNEHQKFHMKHLMSLLSELQDLFHTHFQQTFLQKVYWNEKEKTVSIPISILDSLHMTPNRFFDFLTHYIKHTVRFESIQKEQLIIKIEQSLSPLNCQPFIMNEKKELFLPIHKDDYPPLLELQIHYLLLYNLSMICRYETEWWYELLQTYSTNDYPFILQFLYLTSWKAPYLLLTFLSEKMQKMI